MAEEMTTEQATDSTLMGGMANETDGAEVDTTAQGSETDTQGGAQDAQNKSDTDADSAKQDAAKDDPAAQVPDNAEGYALQFAKDTQVDTALLDSFTKAAHEMGLTRGQAQKLGTLYESYAKDAAGKAQAAQQKVMLDARRQWEDEIKSSPDFAKERGHIQNALRRFGDPELYKLLDQTNLGAHPKMWAFMAKIGKALAEPGFHGNTSNADKSAAEVLYPNMK